MKTKLFILGLCLILFTFSRVSAQVTIGSDISSEKAALLDLKTKDGGSGGGISSDGGGILFPRVEIKSLTFN